MRKRAFLALLAAMAIWLTNGCSLLQSSAQDDLDATGLKYVAADRADQRMAGEQSRGMPAQLEGFTEKLDVRDGKAHLSLEQAVRRALRSSLDIQVASYTPAMAEADVVTAESVFDAVYFLEGDLLKIDQPVSNLLATGGAAALNQDNRSVSTGVRKYFPTGGSITISENLNYERTNSTFVMSPSYATNFMVELSQPILRNMGFDATKAQIYVASHRYNASVEEFRQKVMDVVLNVETAYWGLVYAIRDVEVSRRSLKLAEEVYRKEQKREEQKMAQKLEVSRARAAVTNRRAELIRAQNRVKDVSDQLKNALNDPELLLTEDLEIVPTDEPSLLETPIDLHQAVIASVENRPELRQLREELEVAQVSKRYYANQVLPKLDVSFLWRRNSLDNSSRLAFNDQTTGDYTDYGTGLTLEVPIGNREAESQHRRSQLAYQQALKNLENTTQEVILQVNTTYREVLTSLEEIGATREARIAAQDTVDGEQARYDVGDVTNDELLRAQRDLEEAERNELQAIVRFNVALIQLERAKGTLLAYDNIHVVPRKYVEAR